MLVITIPNGFGPFEIEKLVLNKTGLRKVAGLINNYKRKGNIKKKEMKKKMTENVQCEHVQFLKLNKFERLISTCDLKIITMGKSSFLAGPASNWLLKKLKLIDWNVHIADLLPPFLCSGWYFVIKLDKNQ